MIPRALRTRGLPAISVGFPREVEGWLERATKGATAEEPAAATSKVFRKLGSLLTRMMSVFADARAMRKVI